MDIPPNPNATMVSLNGKPNGASGDIHVSTTNIERHLDLINKTIMTLNCTLEELSEGVNDTAGLLFEIYCKGTNITHTTDVKIPEIKMPEITVKAPEIPKIENKFELVFPWVLGLVMMACGAVSSFITWYLIKYM